MSVSLESLTFSFQFPVSSFQFPVSVSVSRFSFPFPFPVSVSVSRFPHVSGLSPQLIFPASRTAIGNRAVKTAIFKYNQKPLNIFIHTPKLSFGRLNF